METTEPSLIIFGVNNNGWLGSKHLLACKAYPRFASNLQLLGNILSRCIKRWRWSSLGKS
ncbi:hypothetical protein SESBI_02645 [Sesbania bispinosa]|nr:hypothetical protein SESBI_02645 [Sesbania bispinosa]